MKDEHRENLKEAMKVIEDFRKEFHYVYLQFSDIDFEDLFHARGPEALRKINSDYLADDPSGEFLPENYLKRVFDLDYRWRRDYHRKKDAYAFLLHSDWRHFDNSLDGMIKRFKYYLAKEEKIVDGQWEFWNFRNQWWVYGGI